MAKPFQASLDAEVILNCRLPVPPSYANSFTVLSSLTRTRKSLPYNNCLGYFGIFLVIYSWEQKISSDATVGSIASYHPTSSNRAARPMGIGARVVADQLASNHPKSVDSRFGRHRAESKTICW